MGEDADTGMVIEEKSQSSPLVPWDDFFEDGVQDFLEVDGLFSDDGGGDDSRALVCHDLQGDDEDGICVEMCAGACNCAIETSDERSLVSSCHAFASWNLGACSAASFGHDRDMQLVLSVVLMVLSLAMVGVGVDAIAEIQPGALHERRLDWDYEQ
mmetsp:Transcript_22547/g.40294  ORF Transcript_22547/g.40294 Transcript_22547/m.40294 type:complete len:156 (-) Transcript_22547:100-567(-)